MYIIKDPSPIPQLEWEISRLRGLVRDLERVRHGDHPTRQSLAKAPILENWKVMLRSEPCLTGTMYGHPRVRDGHQGLTTGLWLLAPKLGYARTLSRVYALRSPAHIQDGAP